MDPINKYPLEWPAGREREQNPKRSAFKTSGAVARDCLLHELKLLGASGVIISSDRRVRADGLYYAVRSPGEDPAVAVYFTLKGAQMVFSCDRWDLLHDNVHAIRKTVEALRGITRWGSGDALARAFSGFEQLPAPGSAFDPVRPWWQVLGCDQGSIPSYVSACYRDERNKSHPDKNGGSNEAFQAVQDAYQAFKDERGL